MSGFYVYWGVGLIMVFITLMRCRELTEKNGTAAVAFAGILVSFIWPIPIIVGVADLIRKRLG